MDIDRRTMLATLLAGTSGVGLGAWEQAAASDPSLYIPKAHLVEDRAFLHDFLDDFPFADLVTPAPTLRITHIPALIDRTSGRYGTILGHISAQNPQRATFDGTHTAVVVFKGPHGYISPSWYANREVVPTWNFAVVHATGRPKAIVDPSQTHALLARLIRKFEATIGPSDYDFEKLPESYVTGLMKGIAPFTMEIDALEGKFKLGQERSDGDKQGVLAHLSKGGYREHSLYEMTEAFYRRRPASA
jgi:transcriptional regulator